MWKEKTALSRVKKARHEIVPRISGMELFLSSMDYDSGLVLRYFVPMFS
jgi:hypothetical protein